MLASMLRRKHLFFLYLSAVCVAVLTTVGCKAPQAFGDRNSIIVLADPALWSRIDSLFLSRVELRAYTTRPERVFNVTHVSTGDTLWNDLRQWQELVVVGTAGHPVVEDLLKRRREEVGPPPTIFEAHDVWAGRQTVTVLLLPPERPAEAVPTQLDRLAERLQERYRDWVRRRMYASGVNDSLHSVLAAYGFTLQLPRVYDHGRQDSLFRFRSVYPDPGSLLRSVLVTWKTDGALPTPEALRGWREAIDTTIYQPNQEILERGQRYDTLSVGDRTALEYRGVWQDRSDFPAAGPFIVRAVPCPDQGRTYYMDGWVYAPGKDKHLYVLQLQEILDSFRCSPDPPVQVSRTTRPVRRNPMSNPIHPSP